jgi:hypothetical protein
MSRPRATMRLPAMRPAFATLAACAATALLAMTLSASADPPVSSTTAATGPASANVQSVTTQRAGQSILQHLQVFGVPIHPDAPVLAPYENSAYRTFGGQPETGRDALLEQGQQGDAGSASGQ